MPSSSIGFSEYLPGLLLVSGVGLLTFLMLINLRTKLRRRLWAAANPGASSTATESSARTPQASSFAPRISTNSLSAPTAASGSVSASRYSAEQFAALDHAAVEAHETYRKLIADLQTRSVTLEILIRQADERIAAIEHALDQVVGVSISPTHRPEIAFINTTTAANNKEPATTTSKTPSSSHYFEDEDLPQVVVRKTSNNDTVASAVAANRHNGAVNHHLHQQTRHMADSREEEAKQQRIEETLDPLTASIYELADRGRSPIEIAQYLDEQVGKIELILALRPDRTNAAAVASR